MHLARRRRNLTMAAAVAFVAAVIVVLSRIIPHLYMRYPPVWPDEGLFANPAINLIREGHMGTTLIGSLIEGMDKRTYWMPPVYFISLAGFFKVFGIGIEQMRLFSYTLATLSVAVIGYTAWRLSRSLPAALISIAVLTTDVIFVRAAGIGRMDVMAILFTMASLLSYSKATVTKAGKLSLWHLLAGGLASLAWLTHPLGLCAIAAISLDYLWQLASFGYNRIRGKKIDVINLTHVAQLYLAFLVVCLPWVAYISRDTTSFIKQFGGQLIRKANRSPLGLGILQVPFWEYGQAGISAGITALLSSIGLGMGGRKYRPYIILAVVTYLVVCVSREMWYAAYLPPLWSLGLAALLSSLWTKVCQSRNNPGKKRQFLVILISLSTSISAFAWSGWWTYSNYKSLASISQLYGDTAQGYNEYADYCRAISELLPFGSTVVIAAIPDPYLGLCKRGDLTLYHFVPEGVPVDYMAYRERLETSDYVVVTQHLEGTEVGRFAAENCTLIADLSNGESMYPVKVYKVY